MSQAKCSKEEGIEGPFYFDILIIVFFFFHRESLISFTTYISISHKV